MKKIHTFTLTVHSQLAGAAINITKKLTRYSEINVLKFTKG